MGRRSVIIDERGDPRDRIANQRELFDVSRTVATACPVGSCQAIRLAGQDGNVPTCAHDLSRDELRGKRPRHCLNTIDPTTAPFPEGY